MAENILALLQEDIRNILGSKDSVARIQKDQFGILLAETSKDEAPYIAERIHSVIQHFGYGFEQKQIHIISSVLYVMMPDPCMNAVAALDNLYIALRGRHDVVGKPLESVQNTPAFSRQEMELAHCFNRAIREKRLLLAYQPVIDSMDGSVSHYEALLRIIGDDGSIGSAGALIPIAERMGLIHEIDALVMEMSVNVARKNPEVTIAFNVSNLTTDNFGWVSKMQELIGDDNELARRLIVEITETAIHRDLSSTAYFVAMIQSLGVQVALDDFGSGYTSFRQLKTLSIDMVKIDGAFIRDLVENSDNRFFVKTLLDFTKAIGLKAVAEFVETGDVAKMLMEMGVEYMQGYYFGRPETNPEWLKS